MSDELTIDFRWMGGAWGRPLDRAFAAEIGVQLGDQWMTELEELESRTTMTHLRACTHTLARWLAGNWWRLRWEPETRDARSDSGWRTAHSMANAGGGFAWPNIVFASDGESVAMASFPRLRAAPHEPLRYLNAVHGRISGHEFERKVDGFMNAILTRLQTLQVDEEELRQLWAEVMEERRDPEMARWRRLEAKCGFDPDEGPEELIEMLAEDCHQLGVNAMEEIAAQGRHHTKQTLNSILELVNKKGAPAKGGFRCKPETLSKKPRYSAGMKPWERAGKLAKAARKEWDLGDDVVSNMRLGDLLRTHKKAFADRSDKSSVPIPLALRHNGDGADVYFDSSWGTSRRFAACRLLGHWLERGGVTERLIPATEVKTADQQFQRAFAQEFLCPFEALKERLGNDPPTNEDIDDVAAHFGVSPLVVRTTLVNKGELDREALVWG